MAGQRLATYIWNNYRRDIYKPKQYWICSGHKNAVGKGAKHRESKVFRYEKGMCPFTGFYMDNEILWPIYDFLNKPTNITFKELLEECFEAWIKACNEDIEHQNSDEYISEHLEANEYEFTRDGKCFYS